MLLCDLAQRIGARVLTHEARAASIQIDRVFAANKMSDLLEKATRSTLIVSSVPTPHLLRVADLLDVPSLCLTRGGDPNETFVQAALDSGKVLLWSDLDTHETCRRLQEHGLPCASKA